MSDVVIVPFENKHAEQILEQGLNSEFLELKPEHKKYAYFLKEVGMVLMRKKLAYTYI